MECFRFLFLISMAISSFGFSSPFCSFLTSHIHNKSFYSRVLYFGQEKKVHADMKDYNTKNLQNKKTKERDKSFTSDTTLTKKRERQLRTKPGWYRKRSSHLSKAQKRAINELGPLYSYRYRYNETITMQKIFGELNLRPIIPKDERSLAYEKLQKDEEDKKRKEEENSTNYRYIMEIGFGTGHSLINLALSNSTTQTDLQSNLSSCSLKEVPEILGIPAPASVEKKFLGIEWFRAGFSTCLSLIKEHKLNNVRLIHGDAYEALKLMKDNQLDEILIFFPDPWPNESDQDRRIIRNATLCEINRVLKPNGQLHIATDVQQYAEWTAELVASKPKEFSTCSLPFPSPLPSSSATNAAKMQPQNKKLYGELQERPIWRPRTKYEMKALEKNPKHKIYDMVYYVIK